MDVFALPGLGEVDLASVKEQLALLGHKVPDHVISSFLSEMAAGQGEAIAALDRAPAEQGGTNGQSEIAEEGQCSDIQYYEEAYDGHHDTYLWGEPSGEGKRDFVGEAYVGHSDEGVGYEGDGYSDEGEEPENWYGEEDLEREIGRMQITEDQFRRPMEIKNVWMGHSDLDTRRSAKAQAPVTKLSRGHANRTQEQHRGCLASSLQSQPKRPSMASATSKPNWNDSTVVPKAAGKSHTRNGVRPQSAARSPAFKSPRPLASSNRSYIVRNVMPSPASIAPKKIDRVARNREIAEAWSRDKFLQHGGAGRSGSRRVENFHNYFAQKHAMAARERSDGRRESRAHTVRALEPTQATPSEKRRDGLRFQVRSRMNS